MTGLTTSWRWSAGTFHKNLRCPNALGCAVVFGVASGDRGSLVSAELIKKNYSVVGFCLPNTLAWCELFKPSLKKALGRISSGDLKPTLGVR